MQEIYVPALGMASDAVYLAEWLKLPGDRVEAGEEIAQIETDKAQMSIEAPSAGVLGRHRFPDNTEVPSGATIAVLLADGETEETEESEPAQALSIDQESFGASPDTVTEAEPIEKSAAEPEDAAYFRAVANEHGPLTHEERSRLDSGDLEPYRMSPRNRVAYLAERAGSPSETLVGGTSPAIGSATAPATVVVERDSSRPPMDSGVDRHRAAVATAVSRSWAEIPHFAVQRELRVEGFDAVLRGFRAISEGVTLTDVIAKAFALSLVEAAGGAEIDLGLAVATDRGVAIPVLRDVARRDVLSIAEARVAAVGRARGGQLNTDDSVTPLCTLSNLGGYGVDSFTGIVPIGQKGILTVGAAGMRPVVENGQLAAGRTMSVILNVDHRHWDGQHAAKVLSRLAALAAEPFLLSSFGH